MSGRQTAETFWARVQKGAGTECWPWLGCRLANGYGLVGWAGTQYVTHRVAYWLTYGEIELASPKDRKGTGFVLHTCDNKRCCNPSHLYLGTYSKNMIDAWERGLKKPTGIRLRDGKPVRKPGTNYDLKMKRLGR